MGKSKYFKSKEEFLEVMTALLDHMKYHDQVGGAVARSKIIVEFVYKDPEASVTINARQRPADDEKAYFAFEFDDKETKPDVSFTSSADFGLRFWQGKENPVLSLATGKLKAKGDAAKALALLPAIKPAFKIFPGILRDMGRENMIVKR